VDYWTSLGLKGVASATLQTSSASAQLAMSRGRGCFLVLDVESREIQLEKHGNMEENMGKSHGIQTITMVKSWHSLKRIW